jgi:hypothetical protein
VIALVRVAGHAQSDGRSGRRVESGRGASLWTGPASPGPPAAAVAVAVAEGLRCANRSKSTFASATRRAAAFWEMVVFIAVLAVGLLYAFKKGVLRWA